MEAAFDRLYSEGYITRKHGSGTRVSAAIPDSFQPSSARDALAPKVGMESKEAERSQTPTARDPYALHAGIPFVARLPAPDLLDGSHWRKHATNAVKNDPAADLSLTPLQGFEPLRQQIAIYLGTFRGLACRAEEIFITAGIRHAIDAVARLVLSATSKVAVEDPGYVAARRIFELAGAKPVDIPIDEDGMRIGDLAKHDDISLVYVTPAHQSPLGMTMSIDRRSELLEWSRANEAWIIEDDYDGEFSYQTAPLPALKSDDRHDRVIYCSSFNKTVFTGLRVGFMVVPTALQPKMLSFWHTVGAPVSVTEQRALASFMASGDFFNHLHRSRQAYRQRRDAVLRELERHARGKVEIVGDHAGFHFVMRLRPGTDEQELVNEAAAVGVTLQSLRSFCRATDFGPAFVIGYSALSLAQARYFGKKLGLILGRLAQPFTGDST